MSDLAAKIDRFVRWFFNVSPHSTAIEPQAPRRRASSTLQQHGRSGSSSERRGARPELERSPGRARMARKDAS